MLTFEVDWVMILQFLLGAVLPGLVGLVTKRSTDPGTKAVLLLTIALVQGLLGQILDALVSHTLLNIGQALGVGLASYVLAICVHFGLMNQTGAKDKLQDTLVKDARTEALVVPDITSLADLREQAVVDEVDLTPAPDDFRPRHSAK